MFNSIQTRLNLTYLLLIVIVMLIISLFLLNMLEKYHLQYQEENMTRTGYLAADFLAGYLREEGDPVVISSVAENFSHQIGARIVVVNRQGIVKGDSVRVGGLVGSTLVRPEVVEALQGGIGRSVQYSEPSEQKVMQVAVPVFQESEEPIGVVFISSSLTSIYNTLAAVKNFLLISTLLAMSLVGVLGFIIAHRLTVPIKELTRAAQRMARGELEQRIKVSSRDEIGRLGEQFNIMATQIKTTNQRLRDFVADVSHELRTPLTSMNLIIKSLRQYEIDPNQQKEFLKDLDQETERLINLVQDLLTLTGLESAKERSQREKVSLNNLLRETLYKVRPRVERQGLKLLVDLPESSLEIFVSPDQIKQVLYNLLDNNIKYTPEGGWIEISVSEDSNYITVKIQDSGSGIPRDEMPYIFERFYRVDKARSRDLGGTGLGLAISKKIIEGHRGKIWAESIEGSGSMFCFTLPKTSDVNAN